MPRGVRWPVQERIHWVCVASHNYQSYYVNIQFKHGPYHFPVCLGRWFTIGKKSKEQEHLKGTFLLCLFVFPFWFILHFLVGRVLSLISNLIWYIWRILALWPQEGNPISDLNEKSKICKSLVLQDLTLRDMIRVLGPSLSGTCPSWYYATWLVFGPFCEWNLFLPLICSISLSYCRLTWK